MSGVYNTYDNYKGNGNSLEKYCSKWKQQKDQIQKIGQQQCARSVPITYIARPSYRPIENDLWESGWSKQPTKDAAGSSDREFLSMRPQDNHQAHDSILSSATDIINTEHGFTIQMDIKLFQPRDIQITLHQHMLSVTGDRLENDGTGAQLLCRRFTRKYTIPSDVRLSSISSYVTNNGYLIIKGSRKGWKETDLTEHLASSSISSKSSAV